LSGGSRLLRQGGRRNWWPFQRSMPMRCLFKDGTRKSNGRRTRGRKSLKGRAGSEKSDLRPGGCTKKKTDLNPKRSPSKSPKEKKIGRKEYRSLKERGKRNKGGGESPLRCPGPQNPGALQKSRKKIKSTAVPYWNYDERAIRNIANGKHWTTTSRGRRKTGEMKLKQKPAKWKKLKRKTQEHHP